MTIDRSRYPLATWQDWFLLGINIVFVVCGLFILTRNRDVGIVALALFGSCLVTSLGTILRKYRFRTIAAEKVDVVGGVPIRPKSVNMLLLGAWLFVLGIILFVFGSGYPLIFRIISCCFAFVGVAVFAAALTGHLPGGYLQFDPEHLTVAKRGWRADIPWGAIAAVKEIEFNSNPVLLISVTDWTQLEIVPPDAAERAFKSIARTRAHMGAEFAIWTTQYGIDLPVLAAAVTRYATDAPARTELRARLADAMGN